MQDSPTQPDQESGLVSAQTIRDTLFFKQGDSSLFERLGIKDVTPLVHFIETLDLDAEGLQRLIIGMNARYSSDLEVEKTTSMDSRYSKELGVERINSELMFGLLIRHFASGIDDRLARDAFKKRASLQIPVFRILELASLLNVDNKVGSSGFGRNIQRLHECGECGLDYNVFKLGELREHWLGNIPYQGGTNVAMKPRLENEYGQTAKHPLFLLPEEDKDVTIFTPALSIPPQSWKAQAEFIAKSVCDYLQQSREKLDETQCLEPYDAEAVQIKEDTLRDGVQAALTEVVEPSPPGEAKRELPSGLTEVLDS